MKIATPLGLLIAAIGCAAFTAHADAVGDYKVILERNPFGLKPPPPPPPPPAPPAETVTPTNYKLSGITALFNPPRAMFVNQVPGKTSAEYVSLSEGQRQGAIEVLADGINVKAGTVRVKISGEERTMSFEKDGLKASTAPAVMTAPGVPMPLGHPNPVPPTPGGSMVPAPSIPVPTYRPAATPAPMPAANPGVIPGANSIQRPVRIPITTTENQTAPPPAANIDPVVQTVAIEVNRAVTREAVARGDSPPLPPTDLTGR